MQFGAHGHRVIRINSAVPFFDVLNYAVLVDYDVRTLSPLVRLILLVITLQNPVSSQHFLVHVAQEGEFHADLFGERGVCCGRIDAYSKNFRIRGINFSRSDSRLDRLELFRSTTGKSQDVDSKKDVLLAAVVA